MTDLVIAAADVKLVKGYKQSTGPAGAVIAAGQPVIFDLTSGKYILADASSAPGARKGGIALTSANQAGITITVVHEGILEVGEALAALTFDDDIFISDTEGFYADAAGTAGGAIARVVPGWAATTADRLLEINP